MSAPPHDERVMSPDPCFPSPTRIRRGCDGRRAKRGNRAPVRPGASRSSANDRVEAELSAARSWLPLRRHFGTLDLTAPLHEEGQRRRRDPYRRNGAVRARCLAWLLHRRTDSHIGGTGVGDRINTHVPSSRRQPRWPAIGWTPLVLWNTQKRLSGPVHRRRWMPMRSGAAEGVGEGRRPTPVQIDHGGRRGPFSGL